MANKPAIPKVRSGSCDMSPFTAMSTSLPKAMGIVSVIMDDANREEMDLTYRLPSAKGGQRAVSHFPCID